MKQLYVLHIDNVKHLIDELIPVKTFNVICDFDWGIMFDNFHLSGKP